ncbi:MAG: hypothetical protein CO094_13655 [Anaerolineae bacterium CG_4_9_14_3_um_filter_57_17]|nr:hypothetical protein [bacterium]NCT20124.1 hypothetical protein [bacterium]OIO85239.1 MAG: hypothetical protein AUK01_06565 [Anaerolineae bacterium CG2_30_57_67]PJB64258.1 MAG: hypothetical protein CO094_13655 [Anaerolineae bacterium CG_4_9_14_3_um_filter_57_17]
MPTTFCPSCSSAAADFWLANFSAFSHKAWDASFFIFFLPTLVFNLIHQSALNAPEIVKITALATGILFTCGLLAWLSGKALRLERPALAAVIISAMFANNDNYGLPLERTLTPLLVYLSK